MRKPIIILQYNGKSTRHRMWAAWSPYIQDFAYATWEFRWPAADRQLVWC